MRVVTKEIIKNNDKETSGNKDQVDQEDREKDINLRFTKEPHVHDLNEHGECRFCGANKPNLPYIAR